MDASSLQKISSTLKKIALNIDDSLDAQKSEHSSETPKKTTDIPSNLPYAEPKNGAFVDSLRRDNLAKSVQWYSPRLINKPISNKCLSKLERLLCSENTKTHTKYSQLRESQKFEKLLIDIKSADHCTIEKCLNLIAENNDETVQLIWKLSKQYSETSYDESTCGYCKMRKNVNIKDFSRYLWSPGIISDQLFENIVVSSSGKASQDLLWNDLENELKQYDTSKHIIEALTATLKTYSNTYADLCTEIREWLCDPKVKFKCGCQELHLQLLKPADNPKTGTDTFTTDSDEAEITDKRKSRFNSKSAVSTQRQSFRRRDSKRQHRSQSATSAKDERECVPKRALSCESLSSSQCDTDIPLSVDGKKSTKIYNFHNINGSISVGNHIVRMGNQVSDTSNDSDGSLSNGLDIDLRKSVKYRGLQKENQQGTISANVTSLTSDILLPSRTISSVSEETTTSYSLFKTDRAETFGESNENLDSVTVETEANALETNIITRNTTAIKMNDRRKNIFEFTDDSDHETADNDNKSQNSTMETQAGSSHIITDEETASSTISFKLDNSDDDTLSYAKVKWAQPANDKMFEQKIPKTEEKTCYT